jgi:voltage-gated potassium channel Kch
MLISPLLLIINERLIQPRYSRNINEPEADEIDEKDNPVIIAGFGRFGVVLGRFLMANGIRATILDNNPANIQVLRKFGFKVFYGDAGRADLLEAAGAGSAKVLVIAVDGKENISNIAEQAKKKFPHLKIFARAEDVSHSFDLMEMGVDGQRRETYDSSIDLGIRALVELGFRKYQAFRAARTFRYHDEMVMQELFNIRHDEDKKYFSEVKKFSEQLENLLLSEKEHPIHEADSAWDATSLREEIRDIYEKSQAK